MESELNFYYKLIIDRLVICTVLLKALIYRWIHQLKKRKPPLDREHPLQGFFQCLRFGLAQ